MPTKTEWSEEEEKAVATELRRIAERADSLGVDLIGSAMTFANKMGPALMVVKEMVKTFNFVGQTFSEIALYKSPFESYEAIGCPYGKSIRGWRKWMKKQYQEEQHADL